MYPGVKHIVSILQFFHVFVLLFKAFQSLSISHTINLTILTF